MLRNTLRLVAIAASVLPATAFLLQPDFSESRVVSLPLHATEHSPSHSSAQSKDEDPLYISLDFAISRDGREVELSGQPFWPPRTGDRRLAFDIPCAHPSDMYVAGDDKTDVLTRSPFIILPSARAKGIHRIGFAFDLGRWGRLGSGVILHILDVEGALYIVDIEVLDISSYVLDLASHGKISYQAVDAIDFVMPHELEDAMDFVTSDEPVESQSQSEMVEETQAQFDQVEVSKPHHDKTEVTSLSLADYREALKSMEAKLRSWYTEFSHEGDHREKGVHLPTHNRPHMKIPPYPLHGRPHSRPHHGKHHSQHHGPHHRHEVLKRIGRAAVAILIPVMAGVFFGMTICLVGLLLGRLISFLWFRVVRSGRRGFASVSLDDNATRMDEKALLVGEDENAHAVVESSEQGDEQDRRRTIFSLGVPSIFHIRVFVRK